MRSLREQWGWRTPHRGSASFVFMSDRYLNTYAYSRLTTLSQSHEADHFSCGRGPDRGMKTRTGVWGFSPSPRERAHKRGRTSWSSSALRDEDDEVFYLLLHFSDDDNNDLHCGPNTLGSGLRMRLGNLGEKNAQIKFDVSKCVKISNSVLLRSPNNLF